MMRKYNFDSILKALLHTSFTKSVISEVELLITMEGGLHCRDRWVSNYLCNHWLSLLMLRDLIPLRQCVPDTMRYSIIQ